jgi:hypothetical protein
MKKLKILTKPLRVSDTAFDDLDSENASWEIKAERLQARRWRKLRQEV